MKLFGIVALLAVSAFASASTIRELHEDARTAVEVLAHCQSDFSQAVATAEHVSKVTFSSPRPANPKIRVDSWEYSFSKDAATPTNLTPKTAVSLWATRTTDETGAQPKVTWHCKTFVFP